MTFKEFKNAVSIANRVYAWVPMMNYGAYVQVTKASILIAAKGLEAESEDEIGIKFFTQNDDVYIN